MLHSKLTIIAWTSVALAAALWTSACVEDEALPRDIGFAPRSLDGTQIDGAFHYDRKGNFVFDEDAQRAFDYFLTTEGELERAELDAWVDAVIAAEVSPGQQAAVRESWQAYVAYRAEAAAALESDGSQAGAGQVHEAQTRLLAALDAEFEGQPFALAERERLDRAFALRAVYDELGDDPERRDEALARLDADAAARFSASRAGRYLAARAQLEAARASGASPRELAALRAELFEADNPGAADRLAELDARRAAWAARVATHERARAELAASWIGAPDQLDAALDALEAESFTEAERRRVAAQRRLDTD